MVLVVIIGDYKHSLGLIIMVLVIIMVDYSDWLLANVWLVVDY